MEQWCGDKAEACNGGNCEVNAAEGKVDGRISKLKVLIGFQETELERTLWVLAWRTFVPLPAMS